MQERRLSYAVVTPARNEAENLGRLAECLAAQTVPPQAWIIVDNGSNDDTVLLARSLRQRHGWVRVECLSSPDPMARGGPIVRAFHWGLKFVGHPDVIVKLDADVSFERDFFERLLHEFESDSGLGIAGGVCLEQIRGRWVQQHVTRSHVRGATRAYRSRCLDEILPLEERMGWDGVDELKAGVRGWSVRSIPDLSSTTTELWHSARGRGECGSRRARWRTSWDIGFRTWFFEHCSVRVETFVPPP